MLSISQVGRVKTNLAPLDHVNSEELAANLFRALQAEEKLNKLIMM